MAELDANKTTTTDLNNQVPDFIVDAKALDVENATGETYHYFSEATKNFGYYFNIPEIHSAANSLATYVTGKGIEVSSLDRPIIEKISGIGNDSFQEICWNLEVVKLIVGDSFAEIIRNKNLTLTNLIPISPERVRIVIENNRIKRYDVWGGSKWKELKKENMIHLSNNRIGDQIHGTSQIDATKWIIDARNEALRDERLIKHRELALGVLMIDTENTTKRNKIMEQYANAVKNGEVLVLPKDIAELKDTGISPRDRLEWIRYLEGFFYQTFGVPRIIATSDGVSEVGGKMGYLIFEPIYVREQTLMEEDFWNQVALKIKFKRPPTLSGVVQQDEAKNTGQIGIQPNDMEASMTRE